MSLRGRAQRSPEGSERGAPQQRERQDDGRDGRKRQRHDPDLHEVACAFRSLLAEVSRHTLGQDLPRARARCRARAGRGQGLGRTAQLAAHADVEVRVQVLEPLPARPRPCRSQASARCRPRPQRAAPPALSNAVNTLQSKHHATRSAQPRFWVRARVNHKRLASAKARGGTAAGGRAGTAAAAGTRVPRARARGWGMGRGGGGGGEREGGPHSAPGGRCGRWWQAGTGSARTGGRAASGTPAAPRRAGQGPSLRAGPRRGAPQGLSLTGRSARPRGSAAAALAAWGGTACWPRVQQYAGGTACCLPARWSAAARRLAVQKLADLTGTPSLRRWGEAPRLHSDVVDERVAGLAQGLADGGVNARRVGERGAQRRHRRATGAHQARSARGAAHGARALTRTSLR